MGSVDRRRERPVDADDLVTYRQLEELKYRYVRSLDHKDWDLFAACFTDDATATYGTRLEFSGPGEIVAFMRENLGPTMITVHQVHQPELAVDGDTATGTWALMDRVIMTEHRFLLDGSSYYHDEYRRGGDGRWRISHTTYERIYEQMVSLDDVPSFDLTANRFAPAP
ncbi:nuclear transport factor 2 family protein [soil metagenome]